MGILEIVGSVLTGGATGIVGTVISKFSEAKEKAAERKYNLEVMVLDNKRMEREAELAERGLLIQQETEQDVAASELMAESYKEALTRYSEGAHPALIWVDVVRGLMRPVLTIGLLGLSMVIFFYEDIQNLTETQQYIASNIIYAGVAATLWWFGTRPVGKRK